MFRKFLILLFFFGFSTSNSLDKINKAYKPMIILAGLASLYYSNYLMHNDSDSDNTIKLSDQIYEDLEDPYKEFRLSELVKWAYLGFQPYKIFLLSNLAFILLNKLPRSFDSKRSLIRILANPNVNTLEKLRCLYVAGH